MEKKLAIICTTVPVMVVALVLLIYFGVTIVRPYAITSAYLKANCRAVRVTFHGYSSCQCNNGDEEEGCTSVFPCQKVTVVFSPSGLSPHTSKLLQYYDAGYIREKCSIKICEESPAANELQVSKFLAAYGNTDGNSTYTCFYKPRNPNLVIVEKTSRVAVIMAMFWPSFVLLTCVIVLLVFHCPRPSGEYFGMFRRSEDNYEM